MRGSSATLTRLLAVLVLVAAVGLDWHPTAAGAETAVWRLEQPPPPAAPGTAPVPLGRIGDIEFWAPNRGLLITAGNGSTIKPGVWVYDGRRWQPLATVCGASDGRIAWAGPDEFWTISDGRPGQAANPLGELPPLEDNSLCRFSGGSVVESFATLGFQASSYPQMHAAGCMGSSDCWFGGETVEEPVPPGAFHLHWNGHTLTAEPNRQGHAVWDMRLFEGHLYESVLRAPGDRSPTPNPELEKGPSLLHRLEPEEDVEANGGSPFHPLYGLPFYRPPEALGFPHLAADDEALWAAAGPSSTSSPAPVTVARYAEGEWRQVIGEAADKEAEELGEARGEPIPTQDAVTAIAAEPGGGAWIALDTVRDAEHPSPTSSALVAHVSADGTVSEEQTLPGPEGDLGPKGAAYRLACPAPHDCWLATTQGWLFHLAQPGATELEEDTDPAFSHLITARPADESVPQLAPDTVPVEDSGLPGELAGGPVEVTTPPSESRVAVPLLSGLHDKLVHGSTLELRFHLAVKARVRLLAKRRKTVVASTPMRTLAAGNRKLLLALDRKRWPTSLDLQTHALAPLPTVSTRAAGTNTVTTSLAFPKASLQLGSGPEL